MSWLGAGTWVTKLDIIVVWAFSSVSGPLFDNFYEVVREKSEESVQVLMLSYLLRTLSTLSTLSWSSVEFQKFSFVTKLVLVGAFLSGLLSIAYLILSILFSRSLTFSCICWNQHFLTSFCSFPKRASCELVVYPLSSANIFLARGVGVDSSFSFEEHSFLPI